jgi:hypothetical protein
VDTIVILAQPRENKAPSGCRLCWSVRQRLGNSRSIVVIIPNETAAPLVVQQYNKTDAEQVQNQHLNKGEVWPLRTRVFFISESSRQEVWGANVLHCWGPKLSLVCHRNTHLVAKWPPRAWFYQKISFSA